MEAIIKTINPMPGISRMEIFPQSCSQEAGRIFIIDVDESVFRLRLVKDAAWVIQSFPYNVTSELITLICKLIRSHGKKG